MQEMNDVYVTMIGKYLYLKKFLADQQLSGLQEIWVHVCVHMPQMDSISFKRCPQRDTWCGCQLPEMPHFISLPNFTSSGWDVLWPQHHAKN